MTETDKAARYDELLAKAGDLTADEQTEFAALGDELDAASKGPVNTTPARKASSSKRFAAYNKTLERFVGGVFDTKTEAQEVAKHNANKHKFEIREVD